MISDEAVEAAAKVLYFDNISNRAGDNAPQIIAACEAVARKVLEAAVPYILAEAWTAAIAEAWDEGARAIKDRRGELLEDNPHRSRAPRGSRIAT